MLALTPDAIDIHPLSVALFDVAQVAAGLGHFSVAPRAACDAALVDVTVRRVHKSQYITAAELPGRPGASSWAAHLHGCTASSRHSTCASGCGGSARTALSVIRERKGEPLPLATPGTGLSDESGRHPSSGRPTSRATPAGCTRRCWRSRSRRRRRSPRCSWCRTCRTRAPRARRPRPRVRPKHPAGRCAR